MSRTFLERAKFTFIQEPHNYNPNPNEDEVIEIECFSEGCMAEDSPYLVIRTKEWAVNNVEELNELFEKIKKIKWDESTINF